MHNQRAQTCTFQESRPSETPPKSQREDTYREREREKKKERNGSGRGKNSEILGGQVEEGPNQQQPPTPTPTPTLTPTTPTTTQAKNWIGQSRSLPLGQTKWPKQKLGFVFSSGGTTQHSNTNTQQHTTPPQARRGPRRGGDPELRNMRPEGGASLRALPEGWEGP